MTDVYFGFGDTLFGPAFLAHDEGKIYRLAFAPKSQESKELSALRKAFPKINPTPDHSESIQHLLDQHLPQSSSGARRRLFVWASQGSPFQQKVWRALIQIPPGKTVSYSEIAKHIGHPRAVRAVGSAVGANPIGYLIPCHRVLPKNGGLGQFAWGLEIKRKMLQFENCRSFSSKSGEIFRKS